MTQASTYQLIDFGDGEKLESLGHYTVRRPSPAAENVKRQMPGHWRPCDAWFDRQTKQWRFANPWPSELTIDCGAFVMPVRPTPFGHIGLFPEQAANWQWLASAKTKTESFAGNPKALNLFAYTGASSMALVASGFSVAHVDAAKSNVQSAKEAARANGWDDAPIRYLVDDAAKFVAREVRRENHYHTIVLDPPAFGHSPKGKAWRLERDLWPMLDDLWKVKSQSAFRVLVTGHSPQVTEHDVAEYFRQKQRSESALQLHIDAVRSKLRDARGRKLDAVFPYE